MLSSYRRHRRVFSLGIWSLIAALLPLVALFTPAAQAATTVYVSDSDAPLAFIKSSAVNLVGNGGTAANDVVLYKTVGTYGGIGIDAVVTTLAVNGSISNYDNPGSASTAAGADKNWMINTVGGEAKFRFSFYKAGTYTGANTGIPVILQNVKITSIDLDCSSATGSYQYTDASGFQKYSMMSPTNLAVQSYPASGGSPAKVRFIANKAGSRSSVPEDQVLLKYDAIQTVEFSFGNVVANQTNYFGLVFGGWPSAGTTPVEYTNIFNTPPTAGNTSINVSGTTILSPINFGSNSYSDADNNPYFSVVISSVSSGTLEWYNGSSWVTVNPNQAILISDIEKGYLRYTPGTGTPSISFFANDGLSNSLNTYTLTINLATTAQAITFPNPGTKGLGDGSFASNATTNATGETVTLTSLTPGVCTVSGLQIQPVSAGTCVIVASQPGNSTYGAAAEVMQQFQIVSGSTPTTPQTITFNNPGDQSLDTKTVASGATASSGLTVTLTSNTPSVCTTSGLTINIVGTGSCTLVASQSGNSTYLPASNVTQSFQVTTIAGGSAPSVRTTGPIYDSGAGKVTLTGRVDANGSATNWIFCYIQTSSPSVTNGVLGGSPTCQSWTANSATSSSAINLEVTQANISVSSGKTYYYQVIGRHRSGGEVYGKVWKFTTSKPFVNTTAATSVTQTTATLNGNFAPGGSTYNGYFCFSKSIETVNSPDYSGKMTKCIATTASSPSSSSSNSVVNLSLNISGLDPATTYYYQALSKRSSRTTYSYANIVEFTTANLSPLATTGSVNNYTNSTVTFNGSISANGNSVTPKFCVSETYTVNTLNPTDCISGGYVTLSGGPYTTSTSISYTPTTLTAGKTYYYQAIGTYSGGTVTGAIKSFVFGAPGVTTLAAVNVGLVSGSTWSAKMQGFIATNGASSVSNYFCISETNTVTAQGAMTQCTPGGGMSAPETATPTSLALPGMVSLTSNNLVAGKTYYYQVIGINTGVSPNLTAYGDVLSFITADAPVVTTVTASSIGSTGATLNGTINPNGAISNGSFCLATSDAKTAYTGDIESCLMTVTSTPSSITSSGNISAAVSGLSYATTYYFQAIGENTRGTSVGAILSFTTLAGPPVATTKSATSVTGTSAQLNGTVNGSGALTDAQFCWKQSNSDPGTASGSQISGCALTTPKTTVSISAGTASISFTLSGLTNGLTYYFQVLGTNTVNGTTTTVYGDQFSFVTGAPDVVTLDPSSMTSNTAQLNGTAKSNSSSTTVTFCLATDPTLDASNTYIATCTSNINANPNTLSANSAVTNETATATGLISGTTYYYQIKGVNSQGTNYGVVKSFTVGAPVAETKDASAISDTTATLNGTVDPNGSATAGRFCLSTSGDVDDSGNLTCDVDQGDSNPSPGSGSSPVAVTFSATSLTAGTTYFFQVIGSASTGTSVGSPLQFTTKRVVKFMKNGGSGSMPDLVGDTVTALSANTFSNGSYEFVGWNTLANGSGDTYTATASYDFKLNLTLYAIWKEPASSPAPTPTPTPNPTPTIKQDTSITWSDPSPIFEGSALSSELNARFSVQGSCVYTPAVGTALPSGTHTLSVTCTPTDTSRYNSKTASVTIKVLKKKKKAQIIWFNPDPIDYPTALSGVQLDALASVPGSYTYTPSAGAILTPGTHALNVKFKPSASDDYDEIEANVTILVRNKSLAPTSSPSASSTPSPRPTPSPSATPGGRRPTSTPTATATPTPTPTPTYFVNPNDPKKPVLPPVPELNTREVKAPIAATANKTEVVTVQPNQQQTGVIVSSADWSLELSSTTKFVQGTVNESVSKITIEKGNTVTTNGTGFKPFSQVDLYAFSDPIYLGSTITDQFGNFTKTVPMPDGLPVGDHTFQVNGLTPDEKVRTAAVPITLVPAIAQGKSGSLTFSIYYPMDSFFLTDANKELIAKYSKQIRSQLSSNSKVKVEITGWVQPTKKSPHISYLSRGRANAVAMQMMKSGLTGNFKRITPGHDKLNISNSRRADVVVTWTNSK